MKPSSTEQGWIHKLEASYPHKMGVSYALFEAFLGAVLGIIMKFLKHYPFYQTRFYQCMFMVFVGYALLKLSGVTFRVADPYVMRVLFLWVLVAFPTSIFHYYDLMAYSLGDVLVFMQLCSIFVGIFAYLL